ncbi:lysozyme inhibitor LprI family protein [Sporosarcina cascadiensis]|uniref:lysozyme inhibitor LprI family protein n=1 Tax=Sporosarcina cascadiensis TaxID=2660747 RepID=UPI00129A41B5|nr:lysozyme inhibitor LprI family protein [Sporosarcina cascadiensis]
MRKSASLLILSIFIVSVLSACGSSPDKQLEGAWKIVDDQEESRFLEFSGDRMVVRNDFDSQPETVDYRATDLKKGNFIIDIAEPGTQTYQFFLEGKFEKKEKIKVKSVMDSNEPNPNIQLVKVKNLEKEMEKARKEQEKAAAIEEKKRKKDEKAAAAKEAEKEKAQKAENAAKEQTTTETSAATTDDKQPAKETAKNSSSPKENHSDLKSRYLNKSDQLEQRIMNEARAADPNAQDLWDGFFGQYYDQWDSLLNEIWGALKQSMSANDFNNLKNEQREWIKQKEKRFAELPDETAASRASGMDYLAFETQNRVLYLIEHYMD